METKTCTKCQSDKPLNQYTKYRKSKDGLSHWCKDCQVENQRKWVKRNPTKRQAQLRKSRYNLSDDSYQELILKQEGKCAICQTELDKTAKKVVDHNHVNGKVRGILCSSCNTALGLLQDSPELLARALAYLQNHS